MQRTHAPLMGLATLATLGLAAALPQAAHAQTFTYTGTTVGGPTWNRPVAGTPPTSLSGVGTAVPFSVFTFTVSVPGSYVFQSTTPATTPRFDNFTFLYGGTFSPTAPLTNVLVGNDDNTSIGLSGFTFTLNTTTSYKFVTTGFGNTDAGAFTNTITGPGAVIVPEPSQTAALGLGALGLAGLGLKARRRRAA